MSKRKKLIWGGFVILVLFGTVGMVRQALANTIYLPVVYNDPTLTPSLTPSLTATPTLTPTRTPTRTPTPTSTPEESIQIEEVVNPDPGEYFLNEYVSIYNSYDDAVDFTDWYLRDEQGNKYYFPDAFWLESEATVKVWTKYGNDTSTNLYWDRSVEVWNDSGDCAYLRDDSDGDNELIDAICYSK